MPDATGNSLVLTSAFVTRDLLGDPACCLYTGDTSPDFGQPNPDIAVIVGTLLSGDQVTGSRSGNRQVTLPILCTTDDDDPNKATTFAGLINPLLQTVNALPPHTSFTLTWTPAGGLPVILDCYRGSWTRSRDPVLQDAGVAVVTLTFQAAPYGRSDAPVMIAVGAQLQVDSMDASTPPANSTRDTAVKYEGTASAKFTLTGSTVLGGPLGNTHLATWSLNPGPARTVSAVDASSYASLGFRFRWPAPANQFGSSVTWPMQVTLTLGDGTHTASRAVTVSVVTGSTAWQLVTFPLTGWGSVNLAAVTSWATAWSAALIGNASGTSTANIDDLRAFPAASTSITTSEGAVVKIPAVPGTAPAPAALTASLTALSGLLLHRPPVGQSPDAQILMALAGSPATATVAAANNTFAGTYSVVLLIGSAGSGSRTVTVTATHKQGSTVLASQIIPPVTYTSPTGKFLVVGEITLPLVPVPAENVGDTLQFSAASVVTGGAVADTFIDLALIDTTGQVLLLGALPAGTTIVYVDEPDPVSELGQVYASATDRTAAIGLLGWGAATRIDGGPIELEPGDNRLLVLAPDGGVPALTAAFFSRWLDDRDS